MKLTKKLGAEVLKTYNTVWDAYLRGDMRTFASILDENCHIIGSAAGEVFSNKKSAVKYYKATAEQITGKAEFRNRKISVMPADKGIMVNEQSDFYLLIDDQWVFYGHGRISSLFHKKSNKWKIIHQHGSFPDSKTEEGEQVNTDKIKEENLRLKDAVKRRTIELEEKNHELEIETALERVRAVATSMKEPADMLSVCKTISIELKSLGVKEIRNVQTAIFYESKGTYVNFEYYAKYGKTIITETSYTNHKISKAFAAQMLKGKGEIFITHIKGKKVKDWIAYQKTTNVFIDRFLEKASSLNYYWHSLGPVALGISTYMPLSKDDLNLFKRFLNVFELAHRRYLDIEQAFLQAREARIEASLERMRAAAMSMRRSEELIGVCEAMYKELTALGFDDIRNAQISIKNPAESSYFVTEYSDHVSVAVAEAPLDSSPLIKNIYEEMERSDDAFYQREFAGKDFKNWRAWRMNIDAAKDPRIMKATSMWFYLYSIGSGYLGISTFHAISDEKVELLKRFRNVFELSYRRYVDVSQAEAQAKEAQIELGLERVRARAMAMQNSSELAELVATVFKELTQLDFSLTSCIIWINNPEQANDMLWMSSSEMNQPAEPYFLKPFHHPFFKSIVHAWKAKDPKWIFTLTGKEKKTFQETFFNEIPNLPDVFRQALAMPDKVVFSASFNNFGALEVVRTEPLSDENLNILHRFGKVFDSSYTRFSDLKKAEAQAREAQIEAALEKVRAKVMAMNSSNDLNETSLVFGEQLRKLGIDWQFSYFWLIEEDKDENTFWITWPDNKTSTTTYSLAEADESFKECIIAWKEQIKIHTTHVPIQDVQAWLDTFDRITADAGGVAIEIMKPDNFKGGVYYYDAMIRFGSFGILMNRAVNDEEKNIQCRFATEFERAYTRFLDLQKAEAQAREAQIQLALERVRARTMAMQHSNELQEVVNNVYERLSELEVEIDGAAICTFIEGSKDYHVWIGGLPEKLRIKFNDLTQVQRDYNDVIERRDELFTKTYSGKIKNEYISFLLEETVLKSTLPEDQKQMLMASDFFTTVISCTKNTAFQLYRYNGKPFLVEETDILKRFAKVFEQAYIRFLDLQKAEAQAREAQIEAALERVRARTMAMHSSEDVSAATATMFVELEKLGIENFRGGITNILPNRTQDVWSVNNLAEGKVVKAIGTFNIDAHPFWQLMFGEWEAKKDFTCYFLAGQDKEEYIKILNKTQNYLPQAIHQFPDVHFQVYYFNEGGVWTNSLQPHSEEDTQVMKKFASVFSLTFRRYKDLQKAEAQTRESQIQLSLERVRARTMAMQKSDELREAVLVIYEQLQQLGFDSNACNIIIIDEESGAMQYWVSGFTQEIFPEGYHVPYLHHPYHETLLEASRQKKKYAVIEYSGMMKKSFDEIFFTKTDFKNIPEEAKKFMKRLESVKLSTAFFSFGALQILGPMELTAEKAIILQRFTKVFEQTYTRFLDLQKAEAQARESQIQLALERVRARTMAMQKSDELKEVAVLLYRQFLSLGVNSVLNCGYVEVDEINNVQRGWMTRTDGSPSESFKLPLTGDPVFQNRYDSWKRKDSVFHQVVAADEMKKHIEFSRPKLGSNEVQELIVTKFPDPTIFYCGNFSNGYLHVITGTLLSKEEETLLERFTRVFEQTYTRFLDLQKAESQAREAKIEAVLERVRGRTMAMQKSDELTDVAGLLFEQVGTLGIKTWTAGFNVWSEDNNSYVDYITSPNGGFIEPYTVHTERAEALTDISNARKSGVEFDVQYVEGEKIKQLYLALTKLDEKQYEIMLQDGVQFPSHQYEHFVFGSKVSLMFITYEPVPEAHDIFKRLGKVFEQTYTRFLDLQKAEAQAREAKIEVALERTRTQSMLMQHSNELDNTLRVFHEQVLLLGIHSAFSFLWLPDEDKDRHVFWAAWAENNSKVFKSKAINYPLDRNEPATAQCLIDWKGKEPVVSYRVPPAGVENYFAAWSELITGVEQLKPEYFSDGLYYVEAFMKYGCFGVMVKSELLEDEKKILYRFAIEFERAYTRFLDLQKAEAQANEARIEIALERIRARALAMHKSDELMEVAKVMREQMALLGQPELEASVVHLYEQDPDHILSWRAFRPIDSHGKIAYGHMSIPKNSCEFVREWLTKFYSELKEYTIELSGAKQEEWYDLFFKLAPDVVNSMRKEGSIHDKRYYRFSKFSGGALLMVSKQEPSEEVSYLQNRAAVVFDLAYRRFSDLQKAEAQAREAQIEAALERVRARAMAMQTSEELNALIGTVFTELTKLDLVLTRCVILIYEGNKKGVRWWMANSEAPSMPMNFFVKYADMPFFNEYLQGWKERSLKWLYILQGENKIKTDDFLFHETELSLLPDFVIAGMRAPQKVYLNASFNNFGNLTLASLEPLSDEHFDILLRFAKVFDLTYTRFNDLKQAEAQAKEAKIQLALERVRARTMAMQHSNELSDAAKVLFEQLQSLGHQPERFAIAIVNEAERVFEYWGTQHGGSYMDLTLKFSIDEPHVLQKMYNAWKSKTKSITIDLQGNALEEYFQFMKNAKAPVVREKFGTRRVQSVATFSRGALFIVTHKPASQETINVLERFATVFDSTYTRFLDLQKAEGQAREAQIEAALERVRSKAMAMHKSEDLNHAVATVFNELDKLDLGMLRCGIGILHKDRRTGDVWTTAKSSQGNIIQTSGDESMDIHPLLQGAFDAWSEQRDFSYVLEGEDLINYYQALTKTNFQLPESASFDTIKKDQKQYYYVTSFESGTLFAFREKEFSEEAKTVMKRFVNVFNLTYKRFLDLQKAEAQAREAQIELSLERVRAKAMAMHSTADLSESVNIFFKELKTLGINPMRCGVGEVDEGKHSSSMAYTTADKQGELFEILGTLKHEGHPVIENIFKHWKLQEEYHPVLQGTGINEYYKAIRSQVSLPDFPQYEKHYGNYFYFKEGFLFTWAEKELSEEGLRIARKFTSVLSLTYRRYKDLKEAEAQAREAQIEAALERVRAKAMAMHSSEDLAETIKVFYHQLGLLNLLPRRCGVGLIDKETQTADLSGMVVSENGETKEIAAQLKFIGHPVLKNVYNNWLLQKEYHPVLRGNEIKDYYQFIGSQISFQNYPDDAVQYGYFFFFTEGCVYAWAEKEFTEDELKIYRRFTSVLSLTYKRYTDLKLAEAQAKEAKIEAALEKSQKQDNGHAKK